MCYLGAARGALPSVKIRQKGAQWKQGVVICMALYTKFIIYSSPHPLHPPPTAPPFDEYAQSAY